MRKVTRAQMKENAKASLRGRWGLAIGVMLIYLVIVLILGRIASLPFDEELNLYAYYTMNGIQFEPDPAVMGGYEALSLIMAIVLSPIVVGTMLVYLRISRGQEARVRDMFSPISRFLKIAGLFLYVFIKIFLWSLLFIIPGIIAAYRYAMAFYIAADDPNVGIVEAVERSKAMMKGNKWRLFVFQLSFIGWVLLSPLTFGILWLWLFPYMETAHMNFYNSLILEQSAHINTDPGGTGGTYDTYDTNDTNGTNGTNSYTENDDPNDRGDNW